MKNFPKSIFDLPYDFSNDTGSDIQSSIHCINLLGKDLVGLELGVFEASSTMTMLHNCPNIKTLYAIDSYEPYCDFIQEPYNGNVSLTIDKKRIELIRALAFNRIKYSGMSEKVIFYQENSDEAIKKFEEKSLDFIFVDAHLTYEQLKSDLYYWYPILKNGGLFIVHDWRCSIVQSAISEFRFKNNIDNIMSVFDDTCCWVK